MNTKRAMFRALGAAVVAAMAIAGCAAYAQDLKKQPQSQSKASPPCNTFKTLEACAARRDCSWVAADKSKQIHRPYCRSRPKPPAASQQK